MKQKKTAGPSRKVLLVALKELLSAADDAAGWIAFGEEGNEGHNGEDSWFAHNMQFDRARGKAQRILDRCAAAIAPGEQP